MPSSPKRDALDPCSCARRKRQVLIIMDHDVIKVGQVAAVEDDIKMSRRGKGSRDWLSKRKRERAASNAV